MYNAGRIRRVLIVAPLSILGVWQDEFNNFADFEYNLAVLIGTSAKKIDTLRHLNGNALQVAFIIRLTEGEKNNIISSKDLKAKAGFKKETFIGLFLRIDIR